MDVSDLQDTSFLWRYSKEINSNQKGDESIPTSEDEKKTLQKWMLQRVVTQKILFSIVRNMKKTVQSIIWMRVLDCECEFFVL